MNTREIVAAYQRKQTCHDEYLIDLGVPPLSWLRAPGAGYGVARIQKHGRTYEPCEYGDPAVLLITAIFHDGTPEDIIAFNPNQPEKWWLRRGDAVYLGGHEVQPRNWAMPQDFAEPILSPIEPETPLQIWRHPLNWLRASCQGVVVIDWPKAQIDITAVNTKIEAEDANHRREIEKRLRAPLPGPLPQIIIPEQKVVA